MLHNICVHPASSCSLSIPPSVSSTYFQLQHPFINCLGGGSLPERPVYRVFFLYYHILPYKFILPIPYLFQDLMNYYIKLCNGYWIPFFILEHGSFVDDFISKGYHKQYYPFSNLCP